MKRLAFMDSPSKVNCSGQFSDSIVKFVNRSTVFKAS